MYPYLDQCRGWLTGIVLDLILICDTGQGETGQSTNPASAATDARCRCTIQYHPCLSVWVVLEGLRSRMCVCVCVCVYVSTARNTGANLEAVGTVPVAVNLAPIPLVEQGLHGKITVCTPYRTPKVIESTGILEPITREGQFPTIR
ncbi:hypothetical protein CEK26_011965 [Fusarium fujikuroi]|nr:hypothetical protein CEK27_011982 [Fusarium fujikuroi]QGI85242.1 hypothetical protein CEK25_011971 [Fusarium fujikuroi]QGI98896.1 hypothetical protein CEK26_011965 [Fusarium fujikuroi]